MTEKFRFNEALKPGRRFRVSGYLCGFYKAFAMKLAPSVECIHEVVNALHTARADVGVNLGRLCVGYLVRSGFQKGLDEPEDGALQQEDGKRECGAR